MFRFTNKDVRDYAASVGCPVPDSGLVLVGLEGANLDAEGNFVQLNDDALNKWNGLVGYIGDEFGFFTATVKPGKDYTVHPENPLGAAHLATIDRLPRPYHFKLGIHHGQYPCLVQAEAFTVWRDLNRDGMIEIGEPKTADANDGLHIHHASVTHDVPVVGLYSAGCQVLQDIGDWETFFATVKASGQALWAYVMLNAKHFADWLTANGRI